jgi:deoxyribose-phosphate aldolase
MPLWLPAGLDGKMDLQIGDGHTTAAGIDKACEEAWRLKLRAVCVNGSRVELAHARLEDSGVKVVALCGFPLGAADGDVKRFEVETAVDHGAQEIEVVLNAGLLKDRAHAKVLRELRDLVEAAEERPVCGVVEVGMLTREEIAAACELLAESGASGVATGTGWVSRGGVKPEQIKLLRERLDPKTMIKAVAVEQGEVALELLKAGATRLGVEFGTGMRLRDGFRAFEL